jgi:16S rRNA (cytosine967-C5)-methyltransferase
MLNAVTQEGRLLAECEHMMTPLDPADRARAQRLVTETLRHMDRADTLLTRHMSHAAPPPVQTILRIATYELASGEASHGVVNTAVDDVSRLPRHGGLKNMANAVLRKVAQDAPRDWDGLPVSRIPNWLRKPLSMAWGRAAVAGFETAQSKGAPLDLTPKSTDDAEALAQALGGTLLPTGSVRLTNPGQVSALPGFAKGTWWVQDAAAALPAQLVDFAPGTRVLDLCSAPGGKTLQLAAKGADVTALDISNARIKRIRENLYRTHLKANVMVSDVFDMAVGDWPLILLDAPCSATGTMRRHPDLPHAKDGGEFGELIGLQSQMIDHALSLLAPGGQLVFCTCSLLPDEGECQVEEALARHSGLRVNRAALERPGIDPDWITEEGGLRLRPDYWADLGGMDGFYMAVLQKPG